MWFGQNINISFSWLQTFSDLGYIQMEGLFSSDFMVKSHFVCVCSFTLHIKCTFHQLISVTRMCKGGPEEICDHAGTDCVYEASRLCVWVLIVTPCSLATVHFSLHPFFAPLLALECRTVMFVTFVLTFTLKKTIWMN